ncbi:MAG: hypothetical protein ROR55_21130 [Devosia sp.]
MFDMGITAPPPPGRTVEEELLAIDKLRQEVQFYQLLRHIALCAAGIGLAIFVAVAA